MAYPTHPVLGKPNSPATERIDLPGNGPKGAGSPEWWKNKALRNNKQEMGIKKGKPVIFISLEKINKPGSRDVNPTIRIYYRY